MNVLTVFTVDPTPETYYFIPTGSEISESSVVYTYHVDVRQLIYTGPIFIRTLLDEENYRNIITDVTLNDAERLANAHWIRIVKEMHDMISDTVSTTLVNT
jgi:hypothetical protein